ncbi:MAG: trigger factor family protein [Sphingobacteriales bacterium JAD_PAG50586_3]|nr:MAG: trigger factor family protein [Sphingobacteriales bacterium JAD_PAG50586_3]
MNITRENIGPLNDVLKVTVEAADYADTLEKS